MATRPPPIHSNCLVWNPTYSCAEWPSRSQEQRACTAAAPWPEVPVEFTKAEDPHPGLIDSLPHCGMCRRQPCHFLRGSGCGRPHSGMRPGLAWPTICPSFTRNVQLHPGVSFFSFAVFPPVCGVVQTAPISTGAAAFMGTSYVRVVFGFSTYAATTSRRCVPDNS